MGFHIVTLENAQGIGKKNSFSINGTEIWEPQLGTENQDSTTIGIQTENGEDPIVTKILTIGFRTKNEIDPTGTKILTTRSRIETKLPTKILSSIGISTLTKIVKLMNTNEILDLKYPIADFPIIKLVMDGK